MIRQKLDPEFYSDFHQDEEVNDEFIQDEEELEPNLNH